MAIGRIASASKAKHGHNPEHPYAPGIQPGGQINATDIPVDVISTIVQETVQSGAIPPTIPLSQTTGDDADLPLGIPTSGAAAGTYGDSTDIPVVTVDALGRITSIATTPTVPVIPPVVVPPSSTMPVWMTVGDDGDLLTLALQQTPQAGAPGSAGAQGIPGPQGPISNGPVWQGAGDDGDLLINEVPTSGAAAGTYGDATDIPVVSVDALGRVLSITTTPVVFPTDVDIPQNPANLMPVWMGAGDDADLLPSASPGALPLAGGSMQGIIWLQGIRYNCVFVNDANYSVKPGDNIIIYTGLSANRTVTFPLAAVAQGQSVQIWDGTGNAPGASNTVNIYVAITAGDTVNAQTSPLLAVAVAFGQATMVPLLTGGWILAASTLAVGGISGSSNGIPNVTTQANWQDAQGFFGYSTARAAAYIAGALMLGITQTTALSGTLALTANSAPIQLVTSTAAEAITVVNLGSYYGIIKNTGTYLLTVTSTGGSSIPLVPGATLVYCTSGITGSIIIDVISLTGTIGTGGSATPIQVATVDLAAQAAAITATTMHTTLVAGRYRAEWIAQITTVGSVSSSLGGTNGFQMEWTSQDTSAATASGPTIPSAGNATTIALAGVVPMNCTAATNIQYIFGYTSAAAATMKYSLHIRLYYLGP